MNWSQGVRIWYAEFTLTFFSRHEFTGKFVEIVSCNSEKLEFFIFCLACRSSGGNIDICVQWLAWLPAKRKLSYITPNPFKRLKLDVITRLKKSTVDLEKYFPNLSVWKCCRKIFYLVINSSNWVGIEENGFSKLLSQMNYTPRGVNAQFKWKWMLPGSQTKYVQC